MSMSMSMSISISIVIKLLCWSTSVILVWLTLVKVALTESRLHVHSSRLLHLAALLQRPHHTTRAAGVAHLRLLTKQLIHSVCSDVSMHMLATQGFTFVLMHCRF